MTQVTILVADQEAEHLRQLAHIFNSAGYIPLTVSTAIEAQETILRFKPDLFFLNPVMKGLDPFTSQIRRAKGVTLPPIVLAVPSDMATSSKQQFLTKFGASSIVSAPFTSDAVLMATQNLLGKGRQPLIQDTDPRGFFTDVDETLGESGPLVSLDEFRGPDLQGDDFHGLDDLFEEVKKTSNLENLSTQFENPSKPMGSSKKFTGAPAFNEENPTTSTVRVSADEVQRQMEKIRETLAKGAPAKRMPKLPELPGHSFDNKPRLRYTQQSEKEPTGFESGALTSSDIFGALISDIESGKVTHAEREEAERLNQNKDSLKPEGDPEKPLVPPKPLGPFATQPIPMDTPLPHEKPMHSKTPTPASPSAPLSTGNQYQLLTKIASGGMAEVWKGKLIGEKGFEKIVAIKKILPHLSDNEEFITMFIDEAKVAANLTHPNIAQIYELGKMGDSFFIAMEYVGGYNLRQILNYCRSMEVNIAPEIAAFIGMKLCNALNYAHLKKGYDNNPLHIVHRDVSPQNILISHEGEIKLVDFGIAKASIKASHTIAGSLKGKLLYMSPEQADGKNIDSRSDIFSLASVIYEAVTGKKLFGGESELSVLKNVRQAKFSPPKDINPDIPQGLQDILLKTLSKMPEDRYESAKDLEKAFKTFLKHEKLHLNESDVADYLKMIIDKDVVALRAYAKKRVRTPPSSGTTSTAAPSTPTSPMSTPTSTKSVAKKRTLWPIWVGLGLLAAAGAWLVWSQFLQ